MGKTHKQKLTHSRLHISGYALAFKNIFTPALHLRTAVLATVYPPCLPRCLGVVLLCTFSPHSTFRPTVPRGPSGRRRPPRGCRRSPCGLPRDLQGAALPHLTDSTQLRFRKCCTRVCQPLPSSRSIFKSAFLFRRR